jgi:hypothetical protein
MARNPSHPIAPGAAAAVGGLAVEGELTMAGRTRPLTAELANADGRVAGTITLRQSAWETSRIAG